MQNKYRRLNLELYQMLQQPVSNTENKFLQRAAALATNSACPYRVGVLFVHGNKILSEAVNQQKTHPWQKHWSDKQPNWPPRLKNYLHAEIAGILQAKTLDLQKSTVYVARVNNQGNFRCSYPCTVCLPALQYIGIKRIVCCNVDSQPIAIDL